MTQTSISTVADINEKIDFFHVAWWIKLKKGHSFFLSLTLWMGFIFIYVQHVPFVSVYVIAVKSGEWCGWEQNWTQLIRQDLCAHTWGRNVILRGEWEEDEMVNVAMPRTPFQLQLFLLFLRCGSPSHSKSQILWDLQRSKVTVEMQNTPFKNYLRNKLHLLNLSLYADVALEEHFPDTGSWNLPVVLLLLFITVRFMALIVVLKCW